MWQLVRCMRQSCQMSTETCVKMVTTDGSRRYFQLFHVLWFTRRVCTTIYTTRFWRILFFSLGYTEYHLILLSRFQLFTSDESSEHNHRLNYDELNLEIWKKICFETSFHGLENSLIVDLMARRWNDEWFVKKKRKVSSSGTDLNNSQRLCWCGSWVESLKHFQCLEINVWSKQLVNMKQRKRRFDAI